MKETTATEKLSQVLDTIPKLLLDHAKKRADRPANRLKDGRGLKWRMKFGIWLVDFQKLVFKEGTN